MPFDGDFIDLVNIQRPAVVGAPGFASESQEGTNALAYLKNQNTDFLNA